MLYITTHSYILFNVIYGVGYNKVNDPGPDLGQPWGPPHMSCLG